MLFLSYIIYIPPEMGEIAQTFISELECCNDDVLRATFTQKNF